MPVFDRTRNRMVTSVLGFGSFCPPAHTVPYSQLGTLGEVYSNSCTAATSQHVPARASRSAVGRRTRAREDGPRFFKGLISFSKGLIRSRRRVPRVIRSGSASGSALESGSGVHPVMTRAATPTRAAGAPSPLERRVSANLRRAARRRIIRCSAPSQSAARPSRARHVNLSSVSGTPATAARSAPIAKALEAKVELQDPALEAAAEAALVRVLPLLVDNLEGEVLIGRAALELEDARVLCA